MVHSKLPQQHLSGSMIHTFKIKKISVELSSIFVDATDAIAYTIINSLLYFQMRWFCQ